MRSTLVFLLIIAITLQCLYVVLGQDEEDDGSDFAILDELDEMAEGCDGGCRAPGRKKTKTKTKQNKQQQQRPQQEDIPQYEITPQLTQQYQHYLQYMREKGDGSEQPITIQEFAHYMEYMRQAQESGMSPEQIQEQMKQAAKETEQTPEGQQALKENLPKLKDKYSDEAYEGIEQIPADRIPDKAFGCGTVEIPSGKFYMGSEHDENYEEDGEAPYRKIKISKPFYMDTCEVTNAQFLKFWNVTKMKGKTEAEKYGWSFVFELLVSKEVNDEIHSAVQGAEWWIPVPGSDFRHPSGPDVSFNEVLNYPAMHIGWTDANKYCKWKGGRLPTEAEWEYGCRGGLQKKKFPWGNEMKPNDTFMMNIFTGEPYSADDGSDGWPSTAIVGSFAPNGYGLYDMTGNVWEWTSDFWTTRPKIPPKGRRLVDPKGPKQGRDRVMKGGSYMCHSKTCRRYRCSGRSHAEPDSSTGNLGFRCVYDENPNAKASQQESKQEL